MIKAGDRIVVTKYQGPTGVRCGKVYNTTSNIHSDRLGVIMGSTVWTVLKRDMRKANEVDEVAEIMERYDV